MTRVYAGNHADRRNSRGSQEITRTNPPHFFRVACGLLAPAWQCQARTPLVNRAVHGSSWVQFLYQAKPSSCLVVGGAVADLALVPPFHLASVSGLLSLISCSASRYSGKCCPVSRFELRVGACVSLGGGAGSTSSLFVAPSPSKHPWVVFGWWPLAELPWRPVCSAHGLWLKAPCSPRNRCPLWQAPSPSSSIGDEFKCG